MARKLTERELRQVERWARNAKLTSMLDFFQSLPEPIWIQRPLLLGVNNDQEIFIEGYMPARRVVEAIRNLDEPFRSDAPFKKTLTITKRSKPLSGSPFSALFQVLRKGLPEVCLLQGLGDCRGRIVRSHSIQRARLGPYADADRMVYEFSPLTRPQDDLHARRVGVNRATTFTAFCSRHDHDVFEPIEADDFTSSPEQLFLYHYRAFAHAYYARAHKIKILHALRDDLAARVGPRQVQVLGERLYLNEFDRRDLENLKPRYDASIQARRYPPLTFAAFQCEQMPPVLCAEFFAPSKDFFGRKIQDGKQVDTPLHWISLNVIPRRTGGLVLMATDIQNAVFRRFTDSLRATSELERAQRITALVACTLENFIILPQWWKSLSDANRRTFTNAVRAKYFPRAIPRVVSAQGEQFNLRELDT